MLEGASGCSMCWMLKMRVKLTGSFVFAMLHVKKIRDPLALARPRHDSCTGMRHTKPDKHYIVDG